MAVSETLKFSGKGKPGDLLDAEQLGRGRGARRQ